MEVYWDTQTIEFCIYSWDRRGTYRRYPGTPRQYSSISTPSRTGGGPTGGILGHLDNIVLYLLLLGQEGDLPGGILGHLDNIVLYLLLLGQEFNVYCLPISFIENKLYAPVPGSRLRRIRWGQRINIRRLLCTGTRGRRRRRSSLPGSLVYITWLISHPSSTQLSKDRQSNFKYS